MTRERSSDRRRYAETFAEYAPEADRGAAEEKIDLQARFQEMLQAQLRADAPLERYTPPRPAPSGQQPSRPQPSRLQPPPPQPPLTGWRVATPPTPPRGHAQPTQQPTEQPNRQPNRQPGQQPVQQPAWRPVGPPAPSRAAPRVAPVQTPPHGLAQAPAQTPMRSPVRAPAPPATRPAPMGAVQPTQAIPVSRHAPATRDATRYATESYQGVADATEVGRHRAVMTGRGLRSARAWTSIALTVLLLPILGVLWLWAAGTPAGWVNSSFRAIAGTGQIAGMVAAYLLCAQVVLMCRVPAIDRRVGSDQLAWIHAQLGPFIIVLALLHAVCALYKNVVENQFPVVTGTVWVIIARAGVLAATVGTALLVAVGISSIPRIRRKMKYETWLYFHMFTYLGVGLAFLHQIAIGLHFGVGTFARAIWVLLHLTTLAIVVWYRFAALVISARRHRLVVTQVVEETPGVVSIYVTGRDLEHLDAQAGQFFRWRFLTPGGWWQAHPFSMSAAPNDTFLRVTIKSLGDHTKFTNHIRRGTRVIVEGPYGALTEERRSRRKVLLIGAGVGITPMRALFEELDVRRGELTLLYRAETEENLIFRDELDELARRKGARVHYLLGKRSKDTASDPLSPGNLRKLVPDLHVHDVYLCGPPKLQDAVTESLVAAGVPTGRIHAERFAF